MHIYIYTYYTHEQCVSNITYLPEHCLLLVYHFWWSLCMSIYIYAYNVTCMVQRIVQVISTYFNHSLGDSSEADVNNWVLLSYRSRKERDGCNCDPRHSIMNRWARLKMMPYPITISIFSHLLRKITIDHVMKWGTILFHNHRGCERIFDVHFAAYSLTSRQFTHFSSAFQVGTQDIFKND